MRPRCGCAHWQRPGHRRVRRRGRGPRRCLQRQVASNLLSCLCQPLPVASALALGPPSRSVKPDFGREGSPTDAKANAAGVPDRQLLLVFQANRCISVQSSQAGSNSWHFLALVVFSAGADVTRHLNQSSRFANFRRHSASSDSVSGTFHPKNSTPNLNCANHSAGWLSAC